MPHRRSIKCPCCGRDLVIVLVEADDDDDLLEDDAGWEDPDCED